MWKALAAGMLALALISGPATAQNLIADSGDPNTDDYITIHWVPGGYIVTTSEGAYFYGILGNAL
jgi:hypothetical protein